MIIAFCLKEDSPDLPLDSRFGRAQYFLFYNTETGGKDIMENKAKNAPGGAGARAVQQLVDNKAECVIALEIGPQAHDALGAFQITAFKQGSSVSFKEALTAWENDQLEQIKKPGNKGLHRV